MAESQVNSEADQSPPDARLEGGTYEIIRSRLDAHSKELRSRLEKLNVDRKDVFGAVATKLVGSQRITTENNCVPRDIVNIGSRLLFGYNVFIGLRSVTTLADVFACYEWKDGSIETCSLDFLRDERFLADFANLYKYYRNTVFAKFALIGPHLFMVFRISDDPTDVKTFKWMTREGELQYVDNRSDHEYRFPPQHEFEWKRATHEMHRSGDSPHVSIDDRVFVETLHGDLTIKVEDNTSTGEGIYSEPVEDPDQTLSDAEIYYAMVGNIILLKIRPYQEQKYRYIVFNEKIAEAVSIDSLADAGILLPDGHGLIFPRGYYLQTGERKTFDNDMTDMVFEKRIAAPNGEDFLYIFYNRLSGVYVLLRYNLISQQVDTPIVCSGYSMLEDGTLLYFRAEEEPQKHHAVQIWKTPFCGPDYAIEAKTDNELYKIGNKDIVRCMAECTELLNLIGKQDSYANLYVDIARKAQVVRDSYFWIDNPEAYHLDEPLAEIHQSAAAAIDEYEKVVRTRQNTRQEINRVSRRVRDIINEIDYYHLDAVNDFVEHLAKLRGVRGEVISLRDLRYADAEQIDTLEEDVAENTKKLSGQCVEFLLQPDSLAPYEQRCEELLTAIDELEKFAEARELSERVSQTDAELEMLTEIVSNLKISDATQTTAIIDNISRIYSRLNQVKAKLKNRSDQLASAESAAEFSSQMKLVDQSVINFLDICDTPAKCDEYLTKVAVQLETLESRFAEFDQYIVQLSEKREEVYNAFESRKAQLNEQIARRASALQTSAQRILKGVRSRVAGMADLNEINGYFASDLMIERIRETIDKLRDLGDTVKAEDIESQLKTIQQDTIRQLKDRQALFVDGQDVIRFGEHRFAVNRQALELTVVRRDGGMFFHLTGTGFFEPITDKDLLATREVWDLDVVSESPQLYRAEYLAGQLLEGILADPQQQQTSKPVEEELLPRVREFMAPRYDEGYVKGVHDVDAAAILTNLLEMHHRIGLLRFHPSARALALLARECLRDDPAFRRLTVAAAGMGRMREFFDYHGQEQAYIAQLRERIEEFNQQRDLVDRRTHTQAAEYLFHELADAGHIVAHASAVELRDAFRKHLGGKGKKDPFAAALADLEDPADRFGLIRRWLRGFLAEADLDDHYADHLDETAVLLLLGDGAALHPEDAPTRRTLKGMLGSHPLLQDGEYELDYCELMLRLHAHAQDVVPKFRLFQQRKKELVDEQNRRLRLEDFQAPVLSTFVRNRLIDKVYLPLVGDNLAKQIGAAGGQKRTDRQGLLLLISPPGYGKTTLMAYIANRLGLTFMKVNGPTIGHQVTSLDPAEAPNAAAREELEKLNLSFEMGDNVMIYLDDIQHCNPELLQKFIPLCDATRRVEGVFKGRSKSYDLRGKRVAVVMAGNPYTESGEKFRIPDMLANRSDTYNIGDIVGESYDDFVSSYVENALTANPVLGKLANRSQQDVYSIMHLAETGDREGVEFEGNYGVDEINEYVSTMKKLYVVRQVVLKVNQTYIRSAGQADEYRTEPPFLLQGSYRNMNRIASRVLPVMNDQELWTLIFSAYEQDAQTLTSGAEANLLKFRELVDKLEGENAQRWAEIKKTYQRNKLLGGGEDDKVGLIIRQLNQFGEGLDGIRGTLREGVENLAAGGKQASPPAPEAERIGGAVEKLGEVISQGVSTLTKRVPEATADDPAVRAAAEQVMGKLDEMIAALRDHEQSARAETPAQTTRNVQMLTSVLEEQFETMETWLRPVARSDQGRTGYVQQLIDRFSSMVDGYNHLIEVLREKQAEDENEPTPKPAAKKRKPKK